MHSEPEGGCSPDIDPIAEEAELYDKAEISLTKTISGTQSVTLLKKIISANILKDEAIIRLIELALPEDGRGSSEALLELMILTRDSKKSSTKVKGRLAFAQGKHT